MRLNCPFFSLLDMDAMTDDFSLAAQHSSVTMSILLCLHEYTVDQAQWTSAFEVFFL